MLFNSGTLLIIFILLGSTVLLLLVLLVLGIAGRKGRKLGGLRFLTMLFAIGVIASGVMTPLVYFNYIDMNLKMGRYTPIDGSWTYLKINRDSVELHVGGQSEGEKGTWSLEKDILTITYSDTKEEYVVKDFGTKLYQDDKLVFKYTKN